MYALPHVFGVFPGSLQPSLRMSIFMEEPDNQTKRQTNSLNFYFNNKLKGWIALKVPSDWLLKLRKSFAIHIRATRPGFHPKNLSDKETQGGRGKIRESSANPQHNSYKKIENMLERKKQRLTLCRVILKRKGLELKISIYLLIYIHWNIIRTDY